MPHFTFPLSPDGPAVPGLVGLNDQATAALVQAGQPIPRPVSVRALLDSAADLTAIAGPVARQLGLVRVKQVGTQTAGGSVQVNLYRISLSVYGPTGVAGSLLVWPNLLVTELAVPLPNIDVLIGLDVLRQCLFVLNGPGDQFILGY
ncbi:MAG TPA: aspartyl protease family protein [Gemmataceae bacterium]|nr:aspartyl protease family protein [Gemmataceae bacterium]